MPMVTNPSLTKQQVRSYRYAFILHDQILNELQAVETSGEVPFQFEFSTEEDSAMFDRIANESDPIDALEAIGRLDIAREVMKRSLILAIVADMCHFVYESLNAAAKGKMTVAYTLIRKPLKEHLLLLEWILVDSEGFLDKFEGEGEFAIDLINHLSREEKIDQIEKAIEKSGSCSLPADEIYALRYDKKCHYGFERLCNQAVHLVTNYKHFATEAGNPNFLFSNETDTEDQQQYYFEMLPLVLMHTKSVVFALLRPKYTEPNGIGAEVGDLQDAVIFFILQIYFGASSDNLGSQESQLSEDQQGWLEELLCSACIECGIQTELTLRTVMRFCKDLRIQCGNCGHKVCLQEIINDE